tara:strand:+ start:737 stop:1078 length:342 start_codon:yes stop_codon:yes gene_type:complete
MYNIGATQPVLNPQSLPSGGPGGKGQCCEFNNQCQGYCRLNDVDYFRYGQGTYGLSPEPVDWSDRGGGLFGCDRGHCSQSQCADPRLGHLAADNDCLYDSAARKKHCCADGKR